MELKRIITELFFLFVFLVLIIGLLMFLVIFPNDVQDFYRHTFHHCNNLCSVIPVRSFSCIGTGFIVASGYVLTNRHVIEAGLVTEVKIGGIWRSGTVVKLSGGESDLALIKVDTENLVPLSFVAHPAIGDSVFYFWLDDKKEFGGRVEWARDTSFKTFNVFEEKIGKISANIIGISGESDFGSSGSPIMNRKKEVCGIVFAKSVSNNHVFGIATGEIIKFMSDIAPTAKSFGIK